LLRKAGPEQIARKDWRAQEEGGELSSREVIYIMVYAKVFKFFQNVVALN